MLLKNDLGKNTRNLPADDKEAYWSAIATELESREKGSLSKLSAFWLQHFSDENGGPARLKISRSLLSSVARNAWDPLNRGMADAVLKDFSVASSLRASDDIVDGEEIKAYAKRQYQPTREVFSERLIHDVEVKMVEDPQAAMKMLVDRLNIRAQTETPEERVSTAGRIAEALSERNLVDKLSMAWLSHFSQYIDVDKKDGVYTQPEIERFSNSYNPIYKQFAKNILKDFRTIASVDFPEDTINSREIGIYQANQFKK